ncbi:MAG TPA: ergothioneine biosynthesis protein EgtB [Oxalicibacterium sp.]|nr:ergothioneine biosynthesis protein EgtB [Oxalicibacterium sp.]
MNARMEQRNAGIAPAIATHYEQVRQHSVALAAPLSAEDCCAQSMPDASPIKWHLAHTTWFFETFILERFERHYQPHHPAFRVLFNSYYNGVGDKHARAKRGLLTRPSLSEVHAYRRDVDARLLDLLARPMKAEHFAQLATLVELGLHHEQQHQELMLTDVLHLLSCNPLMPAYCTATPQVRPSAASMQWHAFDAGIVEIGHDGDGFCFDNELPRHRQFVERYQLASRLVTNGEYLAFIEAGGYRDASLWLSEGWDWVNREELQHPLYWQQTEDGWHAFGLHGLQPLDANTPATQISYFEADAYARWAGARLPTEAEWEHAARSEKSSKSLQQLFGECWQWTSSGYAAYPGFQTAEGALGEYNGKFMSNQYVLRGSSCATPEGHARVSYRNFFPATARWQFMGIRLAR